MTVAAFLYDNYYCWSPRSSFAGIFDSKETAKECIKGGRYENQNLETFNLETYEFNRFEWDSTYEIKDENGKQYFKLKYKNGGGAPEPEWIEAEMRSCNDEEYSLESQTKFDAGKWRNV